MTRSEPEAQRRASFDSLLERDIVVGDSPCLGARHSAAGRRSGAALADTRAASGAGTFTLRTSEQNHVARADFGGLPFVAVLIVPFTGLESAFDVDEASLAQILIADFSKPVPDDNVVPLGAFLLLA